MLIYFSRAVVILILIFDFDSCWTHEMSLLWLSFHVFLQRHEVTFRWESFEIEKKTRVTFYYMFKLSATSEKFTVLKFSSFHQDVPNFPEILLYPLTF